MTINVFNYYIFFVSASGSAQPKNFSGTVMASAESVKVIVRCRPMNKKENDLKCKVNINYFYSDHRLRYLQITSYISRYLL